jgi:MFS family permease
MPPLASDAIDPTERRAGVILAAIFGLRMLGLFLILPVFAVHAPSMSGGNDTALVGLALGAYGFTQMFLQIPFGMASDRLGRTPVIVAGLLLFVAGSVVAALATSMQGLLIGRVIQGAGAISGAVTALAADLTREQHRTKIMAMIGSTIGLMFAISLVAAPILYARIGLDGIFWLTAVLALLAIGLVLRALPQSVAPAPIIAVSPALTCEKSASASASTASVASLRSVLSNPHLLRLNAGIFALHLTQMAMFVVLPGLLVSTGDLPVALHWQVYLPAVLASFLVLVPAIIAGERRGWVKPIFIAAIALLLVTELLLATQAERFVGLVIGLVCFFIAFNILEATLPSLVSRLAPPQSKGTALGVYNSLQALGLFLGGALGGSVLAYGGPVSVFIVCAGVVLLWLLLAWHMPAVVSRSMETATKAEAVASYAPHQP